MVQVVQAAQVVQVGSWEVCRWRLTMERIRNIKMDSFKMEKIKILQLQKMVRQVGHHRSGVKILARGHLSF